MLKRFADCTAKEIGRRAWPIQGKGPTKIALASKRLREKLSKTARFSIELCRKIIASDFGNCHASLGWLEASAVLPGPTDRGFCRSRSQPTYREYDHAIIPAFDMPRVSDACPATSRGSRGSDGKDRAGFPTNWRTVPHRKGR
ncbi:hypothetical protein BN2475_860032 [Paraburkholderia ribeironis]|uniref:Uncharacterized protein n=1 Tax=Paraburkholderia ribeironis TaxID=1247936 RepID=A0A1N7SKQ4_9BURK|nr:hypothetical protein BN2475_860032 [Paraburkholderia ribeironis]